MQSSENLPPRRALLIALGLLLTAGFLWVAVRGLHWPEVGRALSRARLWPWLPAAGAAYVAGHLLRGLRCRLLLPRGRLPLITAANVVVAGYAANNILPARAGELVRAALLSERTGLPFAASLTVTLVERLLDGLAIAGLFLLSVYQAALPTGRMRSSLGMVAALFVAAAAALALTVAFPGIGRALTARVSRGLRRKTRARLLRLAAQVRAGLSALGRPRKALAVVALSAAVWILESATFLFLLPALGFPAAISWAVLAMAVTNLGLLLPSTPGFIGVFHFFCMQALVALGAPAVGAFAYAVVVHATFYLANSLWGGAVLLRYGVELAVLRRLRRAAALPGLGPPSRAELEPS